MFIPDKSQRKVIEAQQGSYLVLAPPGCGKTQILTERIRYAHEKGVPYEDMLCLTFTNRAARGMVERIKENIDDEDTSKVYVGNVHRYCSRFLFEQSLLPAETEVIDDDETLSILARYLDEDEEAIARNGKRKQQYFAAAHLASMMKQIVLEHPREVRVHPECLSKDDMTALRELCRQNKVEFTREAMIEIFRNSRDYADMIRADISGNPIQPLMSGMLAKMELAEHYDRYKREHCLVDFEDLLILTFDALSKDAKKPLQERQFKRYPWLQVDEVQDLNMLQLSIVDLLSTKESEMFLGDEQQAIFSFMGAKMSTLNHLKNRCKDNIFYLAVNHRSPKYLLDVFNTYAKENLHIDSAVLPVSDMDSTVAGNELVVVSSNTFDNEYYDAAQQAKRLAEQNPTETTAVVVCSNADADIISSRMDDIRLPYFKVSGTDIFSTPEMKLLLSHLAVHANEHSFIAWARLLKGLHVYEQSAAARNFVSTLGDCSMLPSDLILYPGSSYLQQFVNVYDAQTIVVFDTETTGLDVYADDIVQIAAVKMKDGVVVPGSELSLYIQTERPVPAMLGDIPNPIVEELKHRQLLSSAEAMRQFAEYAEGCVLLGHNADFDYHILDENLKRYLPQYNLADHHPFYFDSLKLTRLEFPGLRQYKLKSLLEHFHLEGENSHLADADVAATVNVVRLCADKAREIIPQQQMLMQQRAIRERAALLRQNYHAQYERIRSILWLLPDEDGNSEPPVVKEIRSFYEWMRWEGYIPEIKNIDYVCGYLSKELLADVPERSLHDQLAAYMKEMTTLREGDLCSSDVIKERVFVSTIHKAKGLEFDNVIVFDVADDRFPAFFSQNDPTAMAEDARKLYVAMTRAKKRLVLTVGATKKDFRGGIKNRQLSRFMLPIVGYFQLKQEDPQIFSNT